MRIALHTGSLDLPESPDNFAWELATGLAAAHSDHSFHLISGLRLPGPAGTRIHYLPWPSVPFPGRPFWYGKKISVLLSSLDADVFIGVAGGHPAGWRGPSILLPDPRLSLSGLMHLGKRASRASQVLTFSAFSRDQLEKKSGLPGHRIGLIPPAASLDYRPLGWEEKARIRERFTGGKQYLYCTCPLEPGDHILQTLKAYSLMKRKFGSNLQLVLKGGPPSPSLARAIRDFYFRSEVHFAPVQEDDPTLIAGAYAVLHPWSGAWHGQAVFQAMASGVPAVLANHLCLKEAGGEAALYADPGNTEEFAGQMERLYKDERLRSELVSRGLDKVKANGRDQALAGIWDALLRVTARP